MYGSCGCGECLWKHFSQKQKQNNDGAKEKIKG